MAFLLAVACLPVSCDRIRNLAGGKGASGEGSVDVSAGRLPGAGGPIVRPVRDTDYAAFVNAPGVLAVVNYGADWCGPCRRMKPVMEEVANEFDGKVLVGRVDVDVSPQLAAAAGARSIPLVVMFRDGREVERFTGYQDAGALRGWFREHTADLGKTVIVPSGAEDIDKAVQPMKKDWIPEGVQKR